MLIGMTGAGCRESNPAYVRTVDAAKERPSTTSPDLAAPADKFRVDTESADRARSNLDGRQAEVATDTSVADGSPDGADLPDASADGTVGDDSLPESRDVRIAGDAVDFSPDVPLGTGDAVGAGLDAFVDRGVDVGVSVDVEGDLNPDGEGDVGADVDAGD
jgi:hypothetical protein